MRIGRISAHAAAALLAVAILAESHSTGLPASGPSGSAPGAGLLETAFRFASAITSDPKDMGRAQELAVVDMASAGHLDRAADLAEKIGDWRRGTSLATIARLHAARGDAARARALADRAEIEIGRARGWHRVRIEAHVAEARAWLGDLDAAVAAAAALAQADPVQYAGRAATIVAVAHAVHGDLTTAMDLAGVLDSNGDYEVSVHRTLAYLAIFRLSKANPEVHRAALEKLMASTEGIPGWKRAEVYGEIARALAGEGQEKRAREAFARAAADAAKIGEATPVRGLVLSEVARSGAALGVTHDLRALLRAAMASGDAAMVIDAPGIYGNAAAGWLALGNAEEAARALGRALGAAEALVNARPRALALVDICRYLGRQGFEPDAGIRARLEALFAGLKAPW